MSDDKEEYFWRKTVILFSHRSEYSKQDEDI